MFCLFTTLFDKEAESSTHFYPESFHTPAAHIFILSSRCSFTEREWSIVPLKFFQLFSAAQQTWEETVPFLCMRSLKAKRKLLEMQEKLINRFNHYNLKIFVGQLVQQVPKNKPQTHRDMHTWCIWIGFLSSVVFLCRFFLSLQNQTLSTINLKIKQQEQQNQKKSCNSNSNSF